MVRGVFKISANRESSPDCLRFLEAGVNQMTLVRLSRAAAHGMRRKGALLSSGAIAKADAGWGQAVPEVSLGRKGRGGSAGEKEEDSEILHVKPECSAAHQTSALDSLTCKVSRQARHGRSNTSTAGEMESYESLFFQSLAKYEQKSGMRT